MTTRRDFLRRGALWVAGAALVEPVARKLWAFPTNPLGYNANPPGLTDAEYLRGILGSNEAWVVAMQREFNAHMDQIRREIRRLESLRLPRELLVAHDPRGQALHEGLL